VIALLAAAVLAAATVSPAATATPAAVATVIPAAVATAVPVLPPPAVIAKYQAALKSLKEPRVFTVEYTMQQTGSRTLDQRHRIFRSGTDERDETLAVNGSRSKYPVVRIFRRRPYRYTVAALAPKPGAYDFVYAGPHRNGKHVDYVFDLLPKKQAPLVFTRVTVDGVTFLPQSVAFATAQHAGRGSVTFAKAERYWVARTASAQAGSSGTVTREQIAFSKWRFPSALPRGTFAAPRPLPTLRPTLP
jgi:hypothetical protein